jgi:HSP20 family protein
MSVEYPGLSSSDEDPLTEAGQGSTRPVWYLSDESQSFPQGYSRGRVLLRPHAWRPPTDVYETDDLLVVRVEIAGMREEDFIISLTDRLLSIRGMRQEAPERRAYYQMEIYFGEFHSEVELPCAVVPEKVKAEYEDGFLRLELPKELPLRIRISDE